MSGEIKLRPANENDMKFILNSWAISLFKDPGAWSGWNPEEAVSLLNKKILKIIETSELHTLVSAEDDNLILGWCCLEKCNDGTILHYVYVKHAFKREGLATYMMKALVVPPVVFTHKTVRSKRIFKKGRHREFFKDWSFKAI